MKLWMGGVAAERLPAVALTGAAVVETPYDAFVILDNIGNRLWELQLTPKGELIVTSDSAAQMHGKELSHLRVNITPILCNRIKIARQPRE